MAPPLKSVAVIYHRSLKFTHPFFFFEEESLATTLVKSNTPSILLCLSIGVSWSLSDLPPPPYLLPLAQGPVLPQQQADLGARLHCSAASPLEGVMRLRKNLRMQQSVNDEERLGSKVVEEGKQLSGRGLHSSCLEFDLPKCSSTRTVRDQSLLFCVASKHVNLIDSQQCGLWRTLYLERSFFSRTMKVLCFQPDLRQLHLALR